MRIWIICGTEVKALDLGLRGPELERSQSWALFNTSTQA